MPEFPNWSARVDAAGGVLPACVRVTRKSSREEEKQRYSHEQQMAEMTAEWGEVDETWWWRESRSGTSFERPTFQDLLDFCTTHKRAADDPGRVEWWAPHRFGRSLDVNGQPDIMKFMSVYHQFEDAGWQLHFLKVPRTGNQLADVINIAVHAYAAAVYSVDLSENASRGRRSEGRKGWWINGQAPWGTKRMDTLEDRVLEAGERSTPGGGGTILVPDPEVLPHWTTAAELLLQGASYKGIGEELYELGLRGPQGGALGHRHVRNFLTNRHLIGDVKTRDPDGEARWNPAKWEPLVDVKLFERVGEEVDRRENQPRNKKRTSKGTFILRPVCSKCGIEYHGGRNGKKQGNHRTYVHAKANKVLHPETYDLGQEHGCRAWTVIAAELEAEIKNLILRERASEEYESEIRAMLLEKEEFQQSAAQAVSTAEERLEALEQQYTRQVRQMTLAQDRGLDDQAFLDVLQETQQKKQAAQAELDKARDFLRSRTIAWDRISAAIDETRNLAEVWDKVGLEERRTLLDWWVLDVLIAVDPIPGMKKANEKTAVVTLRSAPDAPRYFTIGDPSSARPSSSRTDGSASDRSARSKASLASDESTRPRAQAACARTNGSGSDTADVSTGTASGDPQLPSPTQTLRAKPARPARRMAEPLENASQAASFNAVSSSPMSEGDAVPGCDDGESGSGCTPNGGSPGARAAYAGSDAGAENLRENGHTS